MRKILFLFCSVFLFPPGVIAQVETPQNKFLFEDDNDREQDRQSAVRKQILQTDPRVKKDIDFQAPAVEFFQEENVIAGTGGVLISGPGIQAQANEGSVQLDTNDATLAGDVLITTDQGVFSAESGTFNLESETGELNGAEFTVEDGNYHTTAGRAVKRSERQYSLFDCSLTTCNCPDGKIPWSVNGSEADITRDGYAHTYNTTLELGGVPVFYSPYFAFPVKEERQTGLLVPRFGYSSRDGTLFDLPVFVVLDDHTDITVRPFTETKTRAGVGFDFRRAFSRNHSVDARIIYSNESARDDSLRGTVTQGLFDPTFDTDRFGGYYKQNWRSESGSLIPSSFLADINLISDDLFPREIIDGDIIDRTARYGTSRAILRSQLGSYFSSEISGEFNQSIETDDDLVFQRLPEATLTGSKSFRPFGFNPYGLKVISKIKANAVNFSRRTGFDGWRFDITPEIRIPFHFKNFFNSEAKFSLRQTEYRLSDQSNPANGTELSDNENRSIFRFDYKLSTGLERIYDLPKQNWLTSLLSFGARNQENRLQRLKHTIEPLAQYTYIPDRSQDALPLFDSVDRIRERSLITYGVRSSLYGRFRPENPGAPDIVELTPRIEDLPSLFEEQVLGDVGVSGAKMFSGAGRTPMRRGEIRELAMFSVRQSYDVIEERENNNPNRSPFSDVEFAFGLYPSRDFGLKFESNVDVEDSEFSSYGVNTHFRDDRGDIFRARYNFIDDRVSQFEGNVELVLTDRYRLGYYGRYDERDSEFIENRAALRVVSDCDCWFLDVGFNDRINPDKQQFFVSFTLRGIGDITQNIGYGDQDGNR